MSSGYVWPGWGSFGLGVSSATFGSPTSISGARTTSRGSRTTTWQTLHTIVRYSGWGAGGDHYDFTTTTTPTSTTQQAIYPTKSSTTTHHSTPTTHTTSTYHHTPQPTRTAQMTDLASPSHISTSQFNTFTTTQYDTLPLTTTQHNTNLRHRVSLSHLYCRLRQLLKTTTGVESLSEGI